MRKPLSPFAARTQAQRTNRVRIIGGRWRGRQLHFPDGEGLRPTGDRIRETLFNWLMPVLPEARCLDLFAGSGALGFEALSRGAASCALVERNAQATRCLLEAKQLLSADGATVIAADGMHWLATVTGIFDIVFIDPPFADTSLAPTAIIEAMAQRELLSSDPWIYVEQPVSSQQSAPAGFVQYRSQRAGQVSYSLWRRMENIP
ncbi:MAG TPA: 16S rRNA (guanine(966)-N(2))-methyltransferase RsmD [Pseudomonadales bacterium]|nr:16S rRNA (guanine(966)-N(2))-methyltransferase RsmD [Pseudomonadales bacterium]